MGERAQYGKVIRANGNIEWREPENGFRFGMEELQAVVHGRVSEFDLRPEAAPLRTTAYWCQEAEKRGDAINAEASILSATVKPVFGDVILVTGEPLPVVEFATSNGPIDQREEYTPTSLTDQTVETETPYQRACAEVEGHLRDVVSEDRTSDSLETKLERRIEVDETVIRDEMRHEANESESGIVEAIEAGECGMV